MAKYECRLNGNFDEIITAIENDIINGSASASLEDGSSFELSGVRCAVRVFERYSVMGSNRVSLSVTLLKNDDEIFLSAITSGGSQAVFWKINTLGEESFLDCLIKTIRKFEK